jgi:bifunctional UDP-N-acetylglucosamine pyrophosphorylase/glucosamine-1-phosphate N-acetyltransferase
VDPGTTYISADTEIGVDTVVHPLTTIEGRTTIGAGCHIGPMSVVVESQIGDEVTVLMSHVNRATMADGARCGPYAHLRPASKIGVRARIGNFVEIKNAVIGEQAAVSHLSYVGDATIGRGTNIGAGTITCNFDGVSKHQTNIGSGVFVGSHSTLIAPLEIGDSAFIAAGSVVTQDVPKDSLAIGRSRQEVKKGWVEQRRKKQAESK